MSFDSYKRAKDAVELDLIPVMNLLVILIPFLLMGASFFHIGIIPASLPSHVAEAPPNEEPSEKITVNLVVKASSLEFTVSSATMDQAATTALARNFPRSSAGFDGDAVEAYLRGLKERHPTSDAMIVLPEPDVKFEELVAILDRTREFDTGRLDDQGEALMSPLFNAVTFSQFVQEDAFAASEAAQAEAAAE
ncbi:MAG: biopolymer transporter ExbD [Myxococcota bacterium]